MADGLLVMPLAPAGEIVGGAIGQILDRLDAVLAERDQHRRGESRHLQKLVGDAERLALGVELGLEFLEMLAGARLNLVGGVLVEAFDGGNLARLDEGDFLDGGEALRGEELGDHFVHVERLHEHGRALGELRLPALRLRGLRHDVDVPARELGGEAHILALAADGKRELLIGHHHLDALGILVEHDLDHLGRRQRVDDERGRVRRPLDDVDFLALQLVHHRLHATAAHADAGPDRIDGGIARHDRDLGAAARIARHRFDGDDALVNLGDFLREQLGHELGMRARQEDLRPALLAAHVIDVSADAVAIAEILARQRLVAPHDGLGLAEIDDHVAVFDALDDAVHDLADAILVFLVLALALGLAHLLHDDLLGVLRGDPAEIERGQGLGDEVAHLRRRILAACFGKRDLCRLHGHVLDHFEQPRQGNLAGLGIDLGPDLVLAAVAGLCRLLDRVLHGGDHHLAVDCLLARDRIGDLQELQPVGADACLSHSKSLQPSCVRCGRRSRPRVSFNARASCPKDLL